jgi:hypothetical protein
VIRRMLRRRRLARARRKRAERLLDLARALDAGPECPADFFSKRFEEESRKLRGEMRAVGGELRRAAAEYSAGRPAPVTALIRRHRRAGSQLTDLVLRDRSCSKRYSELRTRLAVVRKLSGSMPPRATTNYLPSMVEAILRAAHAGKLPEAEIERAESVLRSAEQAIDLARGVISSVRSENQLGRAEISISPQIPPFTRMARQLDRVLDVASGQCELGNIEAAGRSVREAERLRSALASELAEAEGRARRLLQEWVEMAGAYPASTFCATFQVRFAAAESVRGRKEFLARWSALQAEVADFLSERAWRLGNRDQQAIAARREGSPVVEWGPTVASNELIAFAENLHPKPSSLCC